MTDTIASLTARIAALEAALLPFARAGTAYIIEELPDDYRPDWSPFIPYGAYRTARAALHPSPDDRAKVDIAEECARLLDEAAQIRRTRAAQAEEAGEHTIAIKMAHELEFIAADFRARFGRPA